VNLCQVDDDNGNCFFCSSFAPRDFIESLEIDTSDQQVSHIYASSYGSVLIYSNNI